MSARENGGSSFGASPSGWAVEVVHPSGHVHRPATMDDPEPERNPVANALPTISIPVRRDEKWSDESFEDVPMRVWYDGKRQPIDTLEEVQQTEQASVLRGRGGQELERRYKEEIRQQPASEFVEQAVESTTGYTANVDHPETTRENGIELDVPYQDPDWIERTEIDDTDPVLIKGGAVQLAQSCYLLDGTHTALGTRSGDAYNGGEISMLTDEPVARFHFQTEYDIPSQHVGIKIRDRTWPGGGEVEMRWDGTTIARIGNPKGLGWRELGSFSPKGNVPTYQAAIGADIRAGEDHLLTFHTTGSAAEIGLDVVAVYDKRFDYSWPNPGSDNNGGALSGPELYPQARDVPFSAPTPPRAVVGGELRVGTPTGVERSMLSNTQGRNYGAASGDSFVVDFNEPGPSLEPMITLSRFGDDPDRGKIPTQGFRTQEIEYYYLWADLADIPMVTNESFDGDLVDVLSSVAEDTNGVFEFRQRGGEGTVEWTQPGQRTADRNPSISSYEVNKTTSERVEKVAVYGGTREKTGVRAVIQSGEEGKTIPLKDDHLRQGSVEIENMQTGATMQSGRDYTVDHQAGRIDTKASGQMDPSSSYTISYRYQTYGEAQLPGVSDPTVTTEEKSGLSSNFAAEQAARRIVDELQEPLVRGTLTLSGDEVGYSVVEALSAADLPGGVGTGTGGIQIKEVTNRPGETEMRVGSHRSIEEIVSDIESNISAVEREL